MFWGCSSLESISLPEGVSILHDNLFRDCASLVSATLPSSIDSIDFNLFTHCNNLKDVYCYAKTTPITNENVFRLCNINEVVLHVPAHSRSLYKQTSPWNGFKSIVPIVENLSVKVVNTRREYGDNNPLFRIEYTGFIEGDDESILYEKPIISTAATETSDVGEYSLMASGGSAEYYNFIYEPGILTVTKAPLTAKVNDEIRQYGKDNPEFTISYTGLKNGETVPKWNEALKIETAATKTSDVGTYDVTATGIPTNYSLSAIGKGILSITQAPLTIKAENATRKYFETEPSFTFSCSGFLNDDNVDDLTKAPSFNTDATKTSNVGKYKITPSGAEAKNYTISYEQGELTITKRQLKATSHCSRLYGEENPLLPIEYDGFVNNETEAVLSVKPVGVTAATKTSSVGEYPITVSGGEATNYAFVYEQGVLTVTKAPLTAKVNDETRQYGKDNPAFSISYTGLKNGESVPKWEEALKIETTASKTSDVGTYDVTATGTPTNYSLSAIDKGLLSITQAPLTIKAENATRKYFENEPSFTFSCSGFLNDDNVDDLTKTPSFSTDATKTSNVGKYKITPSSAEAKNYTMLYEQGELKITKQNLIATSHCSRKYGEENPLLPIEYSGFVNNETENVITTKPIATTTATKTSSVGEYPIMINGGEATNYYISSINGTLTITPCTLTASVGNYERIYNEENPVFEVKYDGFVGNEDESVLNSQAIANTTATKTSDVGTYKITVSGGSAANYTFSYVSGILTINKAEQTISWGQNLAKLKVGDQIELKATASSGLTVTYSSENPSIAEVYAVGNKYYLDCKGEGELWLVAVQDGNHNYYSSPRIRKNIVIGDASGINVNTRTIARIEKTTTGIRVIDTIKGEMVYVYTSGGQMIYSVKAVDHIIDIPLAKEGVYIVKVGGKTVKLGF